MRLVSDRRRLVVAVAGGPAAGRRRATSSSSASAPRRPPLPSPRHRLRRSAQQNEGGPSASPATEPVESVGDAKFLERISGFLEEDLGHLFDERGIDKSIYDDNVNFEDPITRYSSIDGYLFNIQMLRVLFTPEFILHKIYPVSETTLETRWTMNMTMRVLPWQPKVSPPPPLASPRLASPRPLPPPSSDRVFPPPAHTPAHLHRDLSVRV